MIEVLLIDDHSIVREGLRRIVEDEDQMCVIAEASNGKEAILKANETLPDIVVTDITMPGMDGFEVINQLHNDFPSLPILVLTMHEEEQYVVRAIKAGAMGFLTKISAPEQLVKAIYELKKGNRFLSKSAAISLSIHMAQEEDSSPLNFLSTREIQVLTSLSMGQTNKEIAEAYSISVKTVDTYRLRLLKKLDLRNNADLTRFSIQNKLIKI
jgi:two-component system, NarL family, invasion response regulator UvrY